MPYSHLYNWMTVISQGILYVEVTMINSMTGFGRAEVEEDNKRVTVEIKSVNHRYLDVNIKMPKKLGFFENSIRAVLKEYMQRGKIDIFITYEDFSEANVSIKYNHDIAAKYLEYLRKIKEDFGLEDDIRVSSLSRYPEVFTMDEETIDEDELWKIIEKAVREACKAFADTRLTEGENLKKDLIAKLDGMLSIVDFIEERSPIIISEYRSKLESKVRELIADANIDDGRIVMETTIYADKVCVDEEIVRLRSHIQATKDNLNKGGGIGRKLDFIAQEMNREANTILSKTTDLEISDRGIELKTEIEKVREQIQNIE